MTGCVEIDRHAGVCEDLGVAADELLAFGAGLVAGDLHERRAFGGHGGPYPWSLRVPPLIICGAELIGVPLNRLEP